MASREESLPLRRPAMEDLLAHREFVRGIVRGLVTDEAGIDDAVQETWLAALRNPPRRAAGLRSWLAKVARNCARKAFRTERRRSRRERAAAVPEAVRPAEDAVERASRSRSVLDAVLGLDEPLRTTVLLRYYDGLSAEEIAKRFGITSAAVRKRLGVAAEILRRRLRDHHDGDLRSFCLGMLPLAVVHRTAAWSGAAADGAAAGLKASAALAALAVTGACCFVALLWGSGTAPAPRAAPGSTGAAPAAVARDAPPVTEAAPVAFALRGLVRDADGPLDGAEVTLADAGDPRTGPAVRTRADGTFECRGTARGWVEVRVGRHGYLPWRVTLDPLLEEEVEVVLRRGAPLRVRVLDPGRSPVEGARVSAKHRASRGVTGMWSAEQVSPLGAGTTDAAGCVTLGAAPVGDVWVTASRDGFALARSAVEVAGTDPVECEVVLSRGGTIEGRVLDRAGRPVEGALVRLLDAAGPGALSRSDGSYTLEAVPNGEARVLATAGATGIGFFGAQGWGRPLPVAVQADERVSGIDVVVQPAAIVSARVVDERGSPVAGVLVRLADPAAALPLDREVPTDPEGRFRMAVHPLGRERTVGLSFASASCTVESVEFDLPGPGGTRDLGDLPARRHGVVRGRVRDADGTPLARGRVVVEEGPAVAVAPDGTFEAAPVPAGRVRLHAEAAGRPYRRSDDLGVDLAGGGVAEVEIALRDTMSVRGSVLSPDGVPRRDVLVAALAGAGNGAPALARTDGEGRFALVLPAAEHVVGVVAPSAATDAPLGARLPFRTGPVSVHIAREGEAGAGAPGLSLLQDPAPVRVSEACDLRLLLPVRGALVRGRVVSRRGTPAPEFEIDFVRYKGLVPRYCESRVVRDPGGGFAEELREPGVWAAEVRVPAHAVHRTAPFRVEEGVALDLGDIELGAGGIVQGGVTDAQGLPVAYARIHLLRSDWLTHADAPFTDLDGDFRIPEVAPGTYRMFVVSAGHPLGVVRSLTVAAGATTRAEIRLPEAVRAVLRVVDESGLPVPGAEVHCILPDLAPLSSRLLRAYEPPGWGPGETDAEGIVVKPYAPPVSVLVRVRAPGFAARAEVVSLAPPEARLEVRLTRRDAAADEEPE